MANYYNVTCYRHTGFDYLNRPYSREVLESDAFKGEAIYSQVDGIAVNRKNMREITTLDMQGSVTDFLGKQDNAPNATGSRPLNGPWYSWNQVDYVRLVLTGYPGDPAYVDISGNMTDPWNAIGSGGNYPLVGYYFVTGMEPLARNVTRLYLQFDEWTSCGAAEELEIETGYKIRGMVTESEDSSSYNLATENIGLLEPLVTISGGDVGIGDSGNYNVLATSVNLTEYTEPDSIKAILATAVNGQTLVFPEIKANTVPVTINVDNGLGDSQKTTISAYGYFDYDNDKIASAVTVLYSAGVLELRDCVLIPKAYADLNIDSLGQIVISTNKVISKANPASRDIGGYPRKADYMFGSEVLFSKTTGNMNIQKYSELTDRSIQVWAVPVASGTPYARFKGIKQHAYGYDQAVQGTTWQKSSVVLQGASGATFTQLSAQYAQQSQTRAMNMNDFQNKTSMIKSGLNIAQTGLNAVSNYASNAIGGVTSLLKGDLGGAVQSAVNAGTGILQSGINLANTAVNTAETYKNQKYAKETLEQAQDQLITDAVQQSLSSPSVSFVPDLNGSILNDNGFYCYTVNTGTKDRERLKHYFLRYGYKGLYKPLTFSEINVKKRVNYIQTEGVVMKHKYYAFRDLAGINNLLNNGLWLWNERPNQAAFADNPDN